MVRAMSDVLQDLVDVLPARIWYLTSNGQDMWCRRPYGFLFSSGEAAQTFAEAMDCLLLWSWCATVRVASRSHRGHRCIRGSQK